MSDHEIPVEGPVAGGRYRAVSEPSVSAAPSSVPPPVAPPVGAPVAPGGDEAIGAEVASVRRAAAALDGLADELDGWAGATAALRLALGHRRRDDDALPPPPVAAHDDLVEAAVAVPGLDARRRAAAERVAWDDGGPHRFAAQESERALHALAEVWGPALERRASELHGLARSALATADGFDAAGGASTA